MKKVLIISILTCFILAANYSFGAFTNSELLRIAFVEREIASPFMLPDDEALKDGEFVYEILESVAEEVDVNLFRSAQYYRPDEKIEYVKYAHLVKESRMDDHLKLQGDKNLSSVFLQGNDSEQEKDDNLSYGIKLFGKTHEASIHPLKASYHHLPIDGRYFVEVENEEEFHDFLVHLSDYINRSIDEPGYQEFSPKTFQTKEALAEPRENVFPILKLNTKIENRIILLALTLVFLLYYLIRSLREISISKIHGLSHIKIWWRLIGKQLTACLIFVTFSTYIIGLILRFSLSFYMIVITQMLITYFALILLSIVVFIYSMFIKKSDFLKNKNNNTLTFYINFTVKIVITVYIMVTTIGLLDSYKSLHDIEDKYTNSKSNWSELDQYGVFHSYIGYSMAYDYMEIEDEFQQMDKKLNSLYDALNKRGGVYIDATEFENEFLRLNRGKIGIHSLTVNPNYLSAFPILDEDNNSVSISEANDAWVILIPEQFKHEEEEIIAYFESEHSGDFMQNRGTKKEIIWTKQGQEVFSMNPHVYPESGNHILDPVIHIKTERNGLYTYNSGIKGAGLSDPMKVKLLGKDAEMTYADLYDVLSKEKLLDSTKIVSVSDYIDDELLFLKEFKNKQLGLLVMLGILAIFMMIQNTTILFNRFGKTFIIKRVLGVSIIRAYCGIYVRMFISAFIILGLSVLLILGEADVDLPAGPLIYQTFFIVPILFSLEIIFSTIVINILEKTKMQAMMRL